MHFYYLMSSEEKNKIKLILASKSPRRASIFNKLGFDFTVTPPACVKEKRFSDPAKTVIFNSLVKAGNAAGLIKTRENAFLKKGTPIDIIIAGFDTIVFKDKRFFLKPQSLEEAKEFLEIFSGGIHKVYTGVTLIDCINEVKLSDFEVTEVTFKKLEDRDIEDYLKKENVLDKAGAYNIDGYGCILVKEIRGCFYNVAGMPVYKFLSMMKNLGFEPKSFQK